MDKLKPGDKITFIKTYRKGKEIHCSEQKGVIEETGKDFSLIKLRNGKREQVGNTVIRHMDKPNALTEIFLKRGKK